MGWYGGKLKHRLQSNFQNIIGSLPEDEEGDDDDNYPDDGSAHLDKYENYDKYDDHDDDDNNLDDQFTHVAIIKDDQNDEQNQ